MEGNGDYVTIDLEKGDPNHIPAIDDDDFFQDFYETLVISFPEAEQIVKSMLYANMIEAVELDLDTNTQTPFCWLPSQHKLATLLLYNRGYFEDCQILESSLYGLHVVGCEKVFIDSIVDYVWEKFIEQGFEMIKKEEKKEEEWKEQEE